MSRYDRFVFRTWLSSIRDFNWCLSHICKSENGQCHNSGDDPRMVCMECELSTCTKHQIPWHGARLANNTIPDTRNRKRTMRSLSSLLDRRREHVRDARSESRRAMVAIILLVAVQISPYFHMIEEIAILTRDREMRTSILLDLRCIVG